MFVRMLNKRDTMQMTRRMKENNDVRCLIYLIVDDAIVFVANVDL